MTRIVLNAHPFGGVAFAIERSADQLTCRTPASLCTKFMVERSDRPDFVPSFR